ncbi:hypothetical protein FRC18_007514 [Serendipita sp. 400]|nr:hypothetical protein FRC18_007514 [Serendipita sp. 400]
MVSPSLTSLTLTMKGTGGLLTEKNDVTGGLLCTTVNIAQGLKELHLDIEGFWLVKDMVDVLISFHELEVLTLEVGSPGAFIARDLKAHPTIRKLKLNIQDFNKSITHEFKPLTYHEGDYPALEELTIVGDWYATNLTLRSIVPAPTRTLTVCSFSLPNLRRFAICLEMIVEASPRLEVLQMAVLYDGSLFFWYQVAAALERRRESMSEYFDCVEDEADDDVFGDEDEEGEWMRLGADLKAEE